MNGDKLQGHVQTSYEPFVCVITVTNMTIASVSEGKIADILQILRNGGKLAQKWYINCKIKMQS